MTQQTTQQLNSIPIDIKEEDFQRLGYPDLGPVTVHLQKISSNDTLLKKSGYFIVPFMGKFFYKKIFISNEFPHFWRFDPNNICIEGLVVIDKRCYFVTLEDLDRGLIRKSREVPLKKTGPIRYEDFVQNTYQTKRKEQPSATNTEVGASSVADEENSKGIALASAGTSAANNKSEISGIADLAELAEINASMSHQIVPLFNTVFEEEEYEEVKWDQA